jgi:hypothetical protein
MGSGKSTAIRKYIEAHPELSFISITPRQTLAIKHTSDLKALSYKTAQACDLFGDREMSSKLVVEYESLHRIEFCPDVIIVDEVSALCDSMHSDTNGNQQINNFDHHV